MAKIGNKRLYKAIVQYARRNDVDYPQAVKLLANRVGYKNHTKIYSYVRGDRLPKAANQHRIAHELEETVDYLFGAIYAERGT